MLNKSKFLGYAACCSTENEALLVVRKVQQISTRATHNIWAYRLHTGLSRRFDDGEYGGGERLVALLKHSDSFNVILIVSRWYGGIHLGNARFKCISQAAKSALTQLPAF